ncbi:hypothetical protein Trco_005461 [Trichoderma cornu-damae]|uniref:Uncharacterized protein n=1 Tax=Trichoderma cornu-damae TaxID=654480 RepID=A0A9P8TVE4_9HYPO|nr:hypothetical protein Trco_005461 [Trichoderma cornu-damae]
MPSHLLNGSFNAHLASRDINNGIDEVKVGQLAIRAVVNDVEFMITLLTRIVNRKGSLKGPRLEWQRCNVFGIMSIVREHECDAVTIKFFVYTPPSSHQYNGLGCIPPRSLQDTIHVLTSDGFQLVIHSGLSTLVFSTPSTLSAGLGTATNS